jgi:hypothetical protein
MTEMSRVRIFFTGFILFFIIIWGGNNAFAQPGMRVSASYEFFPFKTLKVDASYPLVFAKGKTMIINTVTYQYSVYDFDDWGFVLADIGDTEQFHSVSYTLSFIQQLSQNWQLITIVTPGMASDFEDDVSGNDFTFKGNLIFMHKFNEAFSLGPGLVYSLRDKPIFPVPFIRFEWIIRSNIIVQGIVPDNVLVLYRLNPVIDLGASVKTWSINHHGDPDKYLVDNPWLKYSDITVGPTVQLHVSKWLHVTLEGGYAFLRKFTLFDGLDEEDSIDLDNEGYFKVGLQLRM